jgi:hypothetical protein
MNQYCADHNLNILSPPELTVGTRLSIEPTRIKTVYKIPTPLGARGSGRTAFFWNLVLHALF